VLYPAIDPTACGTFSAAVVGAIRDRIGFAGLLMTDDLSMGALDGPVGARAARALAAGWDMALHCNGDPAEMAAVAAATPRLSGRALDRATAALAQRAPDPVDEAEAAARYAALVGEEAAHA
jgi:beta-N-acetylhexosaminidase